MLQSPFSVNFGSVTYTKAGAVAGAPVVEPGGVGIAPRLTSPRANFCMSSARERFVMAYPAVSRIQRSTVSTKRNQTVLG